MTMNYYAGIEVSLEESGNTESPIGCPKDPRDGACPVGPDGHVCWRTNAVPRNLRDIWFIVTERARRTGSNVGGAVTTVAA
jgi:hypothetical protein